LRGTPATGTIIARGESTESASRIDGGSFTITGGGAVAVSIGTMTSRGTTGSNAASGGGVS
jgi:hypothetical protein